MNESRRGFLRKASGCGVILSMVGVSGCLSRDPSDDSGPEPGEFSLPNPVIQSTSIPDVEITSHEHIEESGEGSETYTASVVNSGTQGGVVVSLYWVSEDDNEGGVSDEESLEHYRSERVVLEESEEKTVSFAGEIPDSYDGFWFVASPVTVTVVVDNNGEAGDVVISLSVDGEIIDEITTRLGNSEEVFELEADQSVDDVSIQVDARPVSG